ncbi:MAG: molybdopterin adenylyltransferase, partial [Sulfurimonas sp.]
MSKIKIGVITASDRASKGIYEDISGVAIQDTMKEYLVSEFEIVYRCIPDEQDM